MKAIAPHSAPHPDTAAEVASGVTRRLLHAESSAEVREVLLDAVHALGGRTVPARLADDTALPVDLALGDGEPVLPVAEPDSVARMHLQRYLPPMVADARHAHDTLARTERLAREAAVDSLTRLGNRSTFVRRLARLAAADIVIAIDLDDFKATNDTFGHAAGDAVLRAFGACLHEHLRAGDLAARIGGDEFALVLDDAGIDGARGLLDRLRAAWGQQRPHPVGFSAGVAAARPSGPETHRAADDALYAAKAAGRACTRLAAGPDERVRRPESGVDGR